MRATKAGPGAQPHSRTGLAFALLFLCVGASVPLCPLAAQQPAPLHLTLPEAVRRATERGEEVRAAQSGVVHAWPRAEAQYVARAHDDAAQ